MTDYYHLVVPFLGLDKNLKNELSKVKKSQKSVPVYCLSFVGY